MRRHAHQSTMNETIVLTMMILIAALTMTFAALTEQRLKDIESRLTRMESLPEAMTSTEESDASGKTEAVESSATGAGTGSGGEEPTAR